MSNEKVDQRLPESNLPRLKTSSALMQKVDRLGWSVGFTLTSYGVRIGVRSNSAAVLDRIQEVLPGKWKASNFEEVDRLYSFLSSGSNGTGTAKRFSQLYSDHVRLARTQDFERMLEAFDSDFRLFVAEFASHHVFVHAGAVGWKGKGIIVPGRSFSGKSTLVAELVRAGATYYSDEYAVIDSQGRLHPYEKPIEVRSPGSIKQAKIILDEIGGRAGIKPLPIGLVLVTKFKDGARWRPRQLTGGRSVLELLSNTVSAQRNPQRAFEALERIVVQADVLVGPRGEAAEVAPAILRRLEKSIASAAQ